MNIIKHDQGYITLMSVLIIGMVGLTITLSLLLLGTSGAKTSIALTKSNSTKMLVASCSEEAVRHIKDSVNFVGTVNLTMSSGNCSYTVTSQGGQNRTIDVVGTIGTVVRRTKIVTSALTPTVTVVSWQEVSTF